MKNRRTFRKAAATGVVGLSASPVLANRFSNHVSDSKKSPVKNVLRYNGYKTAYEAIRYRKLVDLGLFWFEEPVASDDWRGNAECREELDIPVMAGENEFTRWGAHDLVENHACDIVNTDTIKGGGLTEMRKIGALCSAFHMPIAPHGNAHMNIHAVASISNAIILETYPAKARDFNPALPAFPVKDGMVDALTEPGVGMEPDSELVKKYRIE